MVALVIARRLLALAMVVATSATACTAIVLGIINDSDAGTDAGSSGTSGTSGTTSSGSSAPGEELDDCSLLKNGDYNAPGHDSDCARCIQSQCAANVALACNDAKPKSWFSKMKGCAQRPYQDYPDPDAGPSTSSWGCGDYVEEKEPVTGDPESDTQREYEADKCIHDSCLQGAQPDCKRCEVSHSKGTDSEVQLLKDDECGRCFSENCPELLVECCTTYAIEDYVEYCAYTNKQSNYDRCAQIADASVPDADYPDAFKPGKSYRPDDKACAQKLGTCFVKHCANTAGCKAKQ